MHISYKPLWHTLLERDMRKEDLRLAAGMTTNMIANMSKEGKHISMDTLARICETLVRNASAYAVLIQPLENGGKLTDTLFSGFQLLFLGGVPAFVAVLVLLDQQLHKPGFMLCRIARHFSQIGENARSQKVGADKMSGAVMGTLLVIPTDIAVLFPLISLVTLLIHDAAAVCAKEHTREQMSRLKYPIIG